MEFNQLATISGKSGLFKVVKSGKANIVLETLDGTKKKIIAGGNQKILLLSEISIYTTTQEETVPLSDVLKSIYSTYNTNLNVTIESEPTQLKSFLKSVLPKFDQNRVYISDIKKLIRWYSILSQQCPELLQPEAAV